MNASRVARFALVISVVFWLGGGLWSFFGPESFYRNLAEFPPYNRHLFHDIGAFQIGMGAIPLLALARRTALQSVLGGLALASVLHAVAHVWDRDLGGRDSDHFGLWLFAVVVTAGAVAAFSMDRRGAPS